MEPAKIDPTLVERAALNAGVNGDIRGPVGSSSFLPWFLGVLGLGTFATGSYFFRAQDTAPTASVESAAQAVSVGGILLGILLTLLAVYIAYRSRK